jgi:hypothetical protein
MTGLNKDSVKFVLGLLHSQAMAACERLSAVLDDSKLMMNLRSCKAPQVKMARWARAKGTPGYENIRAEKGPGEKEVTVTPWPTTLCVRSEDGGYGSVLKLTYDN